MTRFSSTIVAFVGCLAVAVPASAQPTEEAPETSGNLAVEKGREAMAHYAKGSWAEALALFLEADGLYHSPVLVLYAARSARNKDELLRARALYRQLATERLEPAAHETWHQAQRDGALELAALEPEIPLLAVVVRGGGATTRLTIDGVEVALAAPIEVDPGARHFVVEQDGKREEETITIRRGERNRTVVLGTVPPPPPAPPPPLEAPSGPNLPGVVLASAGGAALIAGAIAGGVALSQASSAEGELPVSCTAGPSCPSYEEAAVDAAYDDALTSATVADALLFGGGALAITGVVLLIVDPGGTTPNETVSAHGSRLQIRF